MANVVEASMMWAGPRNDVLVLLASPTPGDYLATPTDDADPDVILSRLTDESDEPTGPLVGVEIIDFLTFDRWEVLPSVPVLWQLPGWEPLPLDELLKREQKELRKRALATTKDR